MNWKNISSIGELESIAELSKERAQAIFKHSTRCSISSMAKSRMERGMPDDSEIWYLDLIKHRDVSNAIAEKFKVYHESPQVLIIKNGECTFDASHNQILPDEVVEQLA